MKKTIFILAIALSFSFVANAKLVNTSNHITSQFETLLDVNPLCKSILNGDIATVKKLIDLGMDVNEKSNGLTPAMYAARYNKPEILNLLINRGANLDVKCSKGYTAIKYAKISKASEAIKVLSSSKKK